MSARTVTRRLDHEHGTEGPREDPYSWDAYVVELNGVAHVLRFGALGYTRYMVDDETISVGYDDEHKSERHPVALWEQATGIRCKDFERFYERAHPHFDDPMGSISDYI